MCPSYVQTSRRSKLTQIPYRVFRKATCPRFQTQSVKDAKKKRKKRFSSPYRLHFTLPDHFSIQPSFEADKGGNRKRKARLKIDQFPPTSRTNKSTDASVARRQTSGLKALPQKKRASLVSLVFTILLDAGARRKGSLAAGVNAP